MGLVVWVFTPPFTVKGIISHFQQKHEWTKGGLLKMPSGMSPALKGQVAGIEPQAEMTGFEPVWTDSKSVILTVELHPKLPKYDSNVQPDG